MNQGVTLKDTSLLCVEPSSGKTFSINMGTQQCEAIFLPEKERIDNKIARAGYTIDYLLDRSQQDRIWQLTNESVENYRRMMVPFYLLDEECNPYPVYTDNSTINISLTQSHQLKHIKVSISESVFCKLRKQEHLEQNRKQRQILKNNSNAKGMITESDSPNGKEILVNSNIKREIIIDAISLLSSADSLINLVEQKIEAQSNFSFSNSKRIQLLKFDGIDSFLYGDTQLIYFNDIREHLSSKVLTLQLVLLSFGEEEVTPTMYERHLAKLHDRGFSQKQVLIEFPPVVVNTQHTCDTNFSNTSSKESDASISRMDSLSRKSIFSPHILNHLNKSKWQKTRASTSGMVNRNFISPQHRRSISFHKSVASEQQIVTSYQRVQLFMWYRPQRLAVLQDDMTSYYDPQPDTVNVPFDADCQPVIQSANKQRGCVPFLHAVQPLIPLTTDNTSDILPSCLITQPYELQMVQLRQLTRALLYKVQDEEPIFAPKIKYLAPCYQEQSAVAKFLADCLPRPQTKAQKQSKSELESQLLNPLGNLAFNRGNIEGFNQLSFKVINKTKEVPFQIKPKFVQIQAALYLGCKRLSVFSYSQPFTYQEQVDLSQAVKLQFWKKKDHIQIFQRQLEVSEEMMIEEEKGDLIQIKTLPNCTRLCINVILLPEWCAQFKNYWTKKSAKVIREGMVLGSCSMTLFDEKFLLRQGAKEFRLWPFEPFSARMVCQTQCMRKINGEHQAVQEITQAMNLQVKLPEFASRVGWRLDPKLLVDSRFDMIKRLVLEANEKQIADKTQELMKMTLKKNNLQKTVFQGYSDKNGVDKSNVDVETENLMQVKKLIDAYPMELSKKQADEINLQTVLSNSDFIQKLPIYIKLVDFTDPTQAQTCYQMLETSQLAKDMQPDEALVLLDGQFSDIKVRLFAVQKLSLLNDDKIALIMPQLVQALKYELFHHSPLAEFLLEKAIHNLRVVGHAFYWAVKANLWCEQSLERLFVILERFLMCCGSFKNDLLKQNLVNESLIKLSAFVNHKLDVEKCSKTLTKKLMHEELAKHALRIKMTQQLLIAHAKFDDYLVSVASQSSEPKEEMLRRESHESQKRDTIVKLNHRRTIVSRISAERSKFSDDKKIYIFDIDDINTFIENELEVLVTVNKNQISSYVCIYQNVEVPYNLELLYTPFAPKNPLSQFASEGGNIFLSKKKPLLIVADLADQRRSEEALKGMNLNLTNIIGRHQVNDEKPGEDGPKELVFNAKHKLIKLESFVNETIGSHTAMETDNDQEDDVKVSKQKQLKFLFKCGDDLRQDNLTLQFFKIMDGLWQKNSMNMEMVCYSVMESGFETGYIEFIDNATVITEMHVEAGNWRGPFAKESVMNFFLHHVAKKPKFTEASKKETIEDRLQKYHWTFLKSLAGQCVATYVLGIRDRHPGNYMLHNETGKFFHIDFGHFLGHAKLKLGFQRDREPFIYSDELNYFLVHFGELLVKEVQIPSTTPILCESPSLIEATQVSRREKSSKYSSTMVTKPKTPIFTYEIYQFNKKEAEEQSKREGKPLKINRNIPQPRYSSNKIEEYFENLSVQAFITLRRNADIFVNLLILMLVAGLEELDIKSIEFIKKALFLNVSEEEAAVNFRNVIMEARKQWYRPIDNLFHIISDRRKNAKRAAAEKKAMQKQEAK